MSQFEIVTITFSFVLGVSMSNLLSASAAVVRARREVQLHWLPLTWAACILFQHVVFWFSALSINLKIESWSWSWYLSVLLLAMLLFTSGALILPTEATQRAGDLMRDFREHGRLALLPNAVYQLLWIPVTFRLGATMLSVGTLANALLMGLALVAFRARSIRVQSITVLSFAAVLTWAAVFVWNSGALLGGGVRASVP